MSIPGLRLQIPAHITKATNYLFIVLEVVSSQLLLSFNRPIVYCGSGGSNLFWRAQESKSPPPFAFEHANSFCQIKFVSMKRVLILWHVDFPSEIDGTFEL
jgi:hypothetical protein